jgi:hypothetical protein
MALATIEFQVGRTVLVSDGQSYFVATISYIGPDFLMVSYIKKGKSVTVRIGKGQVQTQI